MSFNSFMFGEPERERQFQRFTPEQQSALNQILSQVMGGLGGAGGGLDYLKQLISGGEEAFEKPAMRQFEEQIIPSIAERFTQMGGQRSSAFGQKLGQAGSALAENLAAQRAGLKQQGIGQLASLLGTGLTPQFETMLQPRSFGMMGGLLQGLGGGLGSGLGMLGTGGLAKLLGL